MKKIQRNIVLLKWFSFFEDFCFYAPIAIIYYASITDSYALAMSVVSATMITQAILEVPVGIFSDYIGRKKTLMLGALTLLGSIIFYASANTYTLLVFGAIVEGVSRTLFSGNNNALIYESLKQTGKEKEFPDTLGKIGSCFQLGLGFSALIGSLVAYFYGLNVLFWLTVIPFTLCVIISFFIVKPEIHTQKIKNSIFSHMLSSFGEFIKNRSLRQVSLAGAINYAMGESMHNFSTVFIGNVWNSWAVGIYRAGIHATGFLGYFVSGRIISKFGELRSLYLFGTGPIY